jgi:glycosyltransferase involved in cell wall biosynthesis
MAIPTGSKPHPHAAGAALISVVVPCYNVAAYVEGCINSLLAQTHRAVEVIAVNDRSTDDTAAILDRLAASDDRLIVLHPEENGGPHAARALGVARATGAFIGFVDGDDRVRPEMFATLLKAISDTGSDIAICNALTVDPSGAPLGHKVRFTEGQVEEVDPLGRFSRWEFSSGVLWNKLFRRECILKPAAIPLPRSVDAGEDQIVCIGAFAAAKRVVLVPEDLYLYLVRPDGESISNAPDEAYAFAFLLGCYVACLEAYAATDERILSAIDTLYTRQFRFDRYRVKSVEALQAHHDRMRKDLETLAWLRPGTAYALVHAFDTQGEAEPKLPLRYHLGQMRIALRKSFAALMKGRA